MSEVKIKQCDRNVADNQPLRLSAEQLLLIELEVEREKLNSLFQKVQHFADPRILEISQRLDEIVVKILKLKDRNRCHS